MFIIKLFHSSIVSWKVAFGELIWVEQRTISFFKCNQKWMSIIHARTECTMFVAICERFVPKVLSKQNLNWQLSFPWMSSMNSARIFFCEKKLSEPAASCVRDKNVTTQPTWHRYQTGSLNETYSCSGDLSDSLICWISVQFRENSSDSSGLTTSQSFPYTTVPGQSQIKNWTLSSHTRHPQPVLDTNMKVSCYTTRTTWSCLRNMSISLRSKSVQRLIETYGV